LPFRILPAIPDSRYFDLLISGQDLGVKNGLPALARGQCRIRTVGYSVSICGFDEGLVDDQALIRRVGLAPEPASACFTILPSMIGVLT